MPITVPCLKCKTKFQVPSKLAGTTVRCQACGFMLRLPSPEKIQAKKKLPTASAGKSASAGKPIAGSKSAPPPKPKPSPQKPAQNEFDGLAMFDEPFELIDTTNDATPGKATNAASPAPEPTVLSCSHCEGLLYYDPNFANQTVACPHCGNHLVMPTL
jgi:DNA-directed RNA polymerase subunit RPC12/RpoP